MWKGRIRSRRIRQGGIRFLRVRGRSIRVNRTRGFRIRHGHMVLRRRFLRPGVRGRLRPRRSALVRGRRVRGIRRGRRVRVLRLFVDDVLRVGNASVGSAKLAAHDVPGLFQFPNGLADGVHALLADGGQPPRGVVPLVRQGEHHGQQALGFQRQIRVPQMVVAHHGVIPRPFYPIYCHSESRPFQNHVRLFPSENGGYSACPPSGAAFPHSSRSSAVRRSRFRSSPQPQG